VIAISDDFDLGRDKTRMKDPQEAERQRRTVEVLLERFFHREPDQRWELQLVADEVGMGKTFVALATAYSIMAAIRDGRAPPDLSGSPPKVLVIAPQNSLAAKWKREVGEFVRRCVEDEHSAEEAREWFTPIPVDRPDDLARKLRDPTLTGVLVTHMDTLTDGRKFKHYDVKRRLLLGVLFRHWGVRFQRDARERLLKGAPASWPNQPDELTRLSKEEWALMPFATEDEMLAAVRDYAKSEAGEDVERALAECRELGTPYLRDRAEKFANLEQALNRVYRRVCFMAIRASLPLVIVDEAHNWKNGPSAKTNGYGGFERNIAVLARRVLLLTATPFQLRPGEMLELLKVGSIIAPSFDGAEVERRRQHMTEHRENVLRPVLDTAAGQSRLFAKAWGHLSPRQAAELREVWSDPRVTRARAELQRIANLTGRVDLADVARIVDRAVVTQPPELREILREGLKLFAYNEDLSQELGAFVIRHRRRTDHRLVRVGAEFVERLDGVLRRGDRSNLHAAPGIDVRGEAELPHYLLMRCVSEMKAGKGRSSLGTALTGCYSTLLESAEGRALRTKMTEGRGKKYLDLLLSMVTEDGDADHPKMRAVVEAAVSAWEAGEKMLLFCFRTNTARRLRELVDERIGAELSRRKARVLDGANALRRLRSRVTRRDGDLAPLALDRVLWSLRWSGRSDDVALAEIGADALRLTDDELESLARLALRYQVDLRGDRVDRVFVHRAVEHILARRLRSTAHLGHALGAILDDITDERWVRAPYGLVPDTEVDGDDEGEATGEGDLDERGANVVYREHIADPSRAEVQALAAALRERREHARRMQQTSVVDSYAEAPSFWLGREPATVFDENPGAPTARTLAAMHRHLFALTRHGTKLMWRQRQLVFQGLRRAVLRESVLVRILPARAALDDGRWGDLLVERLYTPLEGQRETMADRLMVFLEDLQAADGEIEDETSSRHAMHEATLLKDASFVVLVDGSTAPDRRERIFAGFNSPLLPEVLVCTSVGQEGIDLHRHCRLVVHYDLAWNPAVLEQRTGRVDRIGSKTFRERQATGKDGHAFLEVGVPFLAGTYDERMFEEIRVRAQTFEVLTGGDVAADNLEGRDDDPDVEGTEESLAYAMLPPEMIADLRVRLHVWEPPASTYCAP